MFELNVIWFSTEYPTDEHVNEVMAKFGCKVHLVIDEGVALAKGYANHTMSLMEVDTELYKLYNKYLTGITAGDGELLRQFLSDRKYVRSFSMYENFFNEGDTYGENII